MVIDPAKAESFEGYRQLGTLSERLSRAYPHHVPFLTRRFASATDGELRVCDECRLNSASGWRWSRQFPKWL